MRIDSGSLGMDSARLYRSSKTVRQTVETSSTTGSHLLPSFSDFFQAGKEDEKNGEGAKNLLGEPSKEISDSPTSESAVIQDAFDKLGSKAKVYNFQTRNDAETSFHRLHEKFIQNLLKLIFKQKPDNSDPCAESDFAPENAHEGIYELVTTNETTETFYEESECTFFQATGKVLTDDGREIDININLQMSSRFVSYYSESISTLSYQLTDPLVINFSNVPASLKDVTYFFDLDCDGTEEEISTLGENSGYLALDKNGDGIINDGSELFGTKSGDGFYDLSKYDEDHNGWIDENDSIFEKLKIWAKDEDGNDLLYTLKEKDIGAIALQSVSTDFSLNSYVDHSMKGRIRNTGIFLYESGEVGTIQHLDLAT